jgi:hypothetical protein
VSASEARWWSEERRNTGRGLNSAHNVNNIADRRSSRGVVQYRRASQIADKGNQISMLNILPIDMNASNRRLLRQQWRNARAMLRPRLHMRVTEVPIIEINLMYPSGGEIERFQGKAE